MSDQKTEPFVFYDRSRSIAISYYHIEERGYRDRIFVHTPMKSNFVIEEPYFGGDMISSEFKYSYSPNSDSLQKIPYLERLTHLLTDSSKKDKTHSLIAVLWIKDHLLLTNHLVKSGHYFYRCIPQIGDTNYILIPLYARLGYQPKKNPVMLYHSGSVSDTLLVKYIDIYNQLKNMFGPYAIYPHVNSGSYVNAFPIVFSDSQCYMIQFTEYPACFV